MTYFKQNTYLIPKSLAVGKPQDVAWTTSYKADSTLRSVFLLFWTIHLYIKVCQEL